MAYTVKSRDSHHTCGHFHRKYRSAWYCRDLYNRNPEGWGIWSAKAKQFVTIHHDIKPAKPKTLDRR